MKSSQCLIDSIVPVKVIKVRL